ncbi:MAG: InlB B-repeat-containing protein, partial [Clostridia bacterium]|nr:InlB B-repeat-containing protein [Clostridia bacterium]
MKPTTKLLAVFLAALMLMTVIPVSVFAADSYTVTLSKGSEGKGTSTKKLTKYAGTPLSLESDKSGIKSAYGMQPSAGGSGYGTQRVFIEWNTAQDPTTGKGIGTSYKNYYDADAGTTLYAIWGFEIQYNADGGVFPETGNDIFLSYVVDCDNNNYQNPKTLYGNFDLPEGDKAPVKEGCRRVNLGSGAEFYGLLYPDMSFFTTESAKQNLTIPPTGGKLPWSSFHTVKSETGNTAIEFYAIWEPSVTYKANGGSGADHVEYLDWTWDRLYSYEDYEIMDSNEVRSYFSKPRHVIGSWNTKPDGSGKTYALGQVINQLNNSDPITLYAQWVEAPTYNVTYNANGGSGKPQTQVKYYDEALTLSTDIPQRDGYTFHGWATQATATKAKYDVGATYNSNANLNLYAFWQNENEHPMTVTELSPSSCSVKGENSYVCECGYSYIATLPTLGHNYGAWQNLKDGYLTRFCADCNYANKAPVTYKINYKDMNGEAFSGILGEGTPTTHTFESTTKLVAPTKENYNFDGWYTSPDCSGKAITSIGAKDFTSNITLYAKWSAHSYKITYKDKANAALTGKNPSDAPVVHYFGTETLLPTPEKKGYTFLGWYTDKECATEPITVIGADEITEAVTLYAKWEVSKYTVTYLDVNGGEFSGELNANTLFTHTYGVATKLYNPTKVGYTFGGWYTSADCTTGKVTALAATTYTDDITLYAKWTANKYAIAYKDYNAKALSGKLSAGYPTYHYYDTETVLPIPEKKGYTFLGWYTDKLCTEEITVIDAKNAAAITVYAKWEVNVYSVKYFDANGEEFSGELNASTLFT